MEEEFNSLINKYLDGTLGNEGRVKLEVWLNQVHFTKKVVPEWSDPDRAKNWEAILNLTERQSAATQSETSRSGIKNPRHDARNRKPHAGRLKRNILLPLLWVVALLTVLFSAVVVVREWPEPVKNITASSSGKIILPDGTLVWLRNNTELTYPSHFDNSQREVFLKGEALFEVVRNPSSPFVIRCEEYTAKVLGTSFSIRSTPSDMEVVVLTGTVSIGPTDGTNTNTVTVLHPNQRVVFSRGVRIVSTTPVEAAERTKLVANTSYDMHFKDATLEKVVTKLQDKFDVAVVFENPGASACRISADFTDQQLDATLKMICEALDLTYAINGPKVIISGDPCSN